MKSKEDKYRIVCLVEHPKTNDASSSLSPAPQSEDIDAPEKALNPVDEPEDKGASSPSDTDSLWTPEEFHERLSVRSVENVDELEKYYSENFAVLSGQYGVLLFMYTVLMTKV